MRRWADEDDITPRWLKMWAVEKYLGRACPGARPRVKWFEGKELMLTWNGAWGLLGLNEVGLGWPTVDDACRALSRQVSPITAMSCHAMTR